ncbi:transglycosylase SLT domain-containing protein [Halomonas saccharevitans]|uniref:Transglycosylase SLT domain-containing protein n=1 Tax=Halomonas saccharevitans TaxID=416872 RepID=A0ABU3NBE6_9GAMM|nr:transglycosylase SLT domain-containing protein [Halomonas saccharevitans]MDT8878518.1 transglycosylase SLT domain-containing protein [Halomonas saccharevitans]
MAETISDLLVGLSLDTDAASFQKGQSALVGLRNNALSAGAAITAAAGSATAITRMAETRAAAGFMAESLGLSADEADRLGFAFQQVGGDASNALGALRQMRDLRDQFTRGEGALFTAGEFGIQAGPIAAAQSEMQALLELSEQLQGLNETQRNLALGDLGFEGTGIANLLRGGPGEFRAQLEQAAEFRTLTEEEIETSKEVVRAVNELSRAMDEMGDKLVVEAGPELTRIIDFLTKYLPDAGESAGDKFIRETPWLPDWLADDVGKYLPSLGPGDDAPQPQSSTGSPSMDELLDAVGAVESGNRHRDAQGRLITSPAGARGQYQIMPNTGRDPGFGVMPLQSDLVAEHERFAEDYLGALLREFDGNMDAALAAYNTGPGRVSRLLKQYGPGDFLQHAPQETQDYVPRVRGHLGDNPQAGVTQNINFTINGATDPEAVGRVVDKRVREFASRGAASYRNKVT